MNTAAPTPIALRDLRWALAAALVAMLGLFLMAFDQGQISQTGTWLHEVMHDGRHLLGIPCH